MEMEAEGCVRDGEQRSLTLTILLLTHSHTRERGRREITLPIPTKPPTLIVIPFGPPSLPPSHSWRDAPDVYVFVQSGVYNMQFAYLPDTHTQREDPQKSFFVSSSHTLVLKPNFSFHISQHTQSTSTHTHTHTQATASVAAARVCGYIEIVAEVGEERAPRDLCVKMSSQSDDEEDEKCPLCCEDLDVTDQNFFPCPCGYQVNTHVCVLCVYVYAGDCGAGGGAELCISLCGGNRIG